MINELKNLGLSENEAKVYSAMLELGPSSVMEIAAKSEVNRPTAYVQIESLKKKGLVSTQSKGSKQIFIAESPEQLENMLDHQLHDISVRKQELGQILPNLLSMYQSTGSRPQVRFFEGKEGLLRMQEVILKSDISEVMGITSLDDLFNLFPNHPTDYAQRRIKKGIKSKFIYSYSKGDILSKDDEKMLRESRFVPPDKMPFSGDVTIFGNNVAISSVKKNISGVIIEHSDIADSFRGFFNFLWDYASQFNNK